MTGGERCVIVTGGTRGIGAAISSAFLATGARVTAIYAANDAAARDFAAHETASGERLELERLDLRDGAAVAAFWPRWREAHPALDVLVQSAGISRDALVAAMKDEDWQAVLAVNLEAAFRMAREAVKTMMGDRRRPGRIVNISSPAARLGLEGQAAYAASKAGLEAFTRSLAREVARRPITVNCVAPGFVDTEMIAGLDEARRETYRALVPMRRFGRPEEIAAAVLFLTSPEASYITGAVLDVSGGL